MSEWKKVKIGDFLTEREGRYKPNDSKISKYKRLDKIDFSGTIHISDKPTKTDMIIVHPGDLVISGINVAKGAVAVYQGNEPVCATIHYSSYTFDSSKADLDYFKFFVKSPAFITALQKQVKGGIKTEIKPKHLLPLEISIPDLQTQREILQKISLQLQRTEQLSLEIESQKNYIKQLRQNILQEAIEGKLSAAWRKQNPVQKGNPDYDAEALFEQIQKEKYHTDSILLTQNQDKKKKGNSLDFPNPCDNEEKPFAIPDGWKWVRLGEICKSITDGDHLPPPKQNSGIPFIVISDVSSGVIDFRGNRYVPEGYYEKLQSDKKPQKGDILYTVTGSYGIPVFVNDLRFCVQRHIGIIKPCTQIRIYIYHFLQSPICKKQADSVAWGVAVKTIPIKELRNFALPLPPVKEQEEIVAQVEKHLQTVSDLENQITEREELTKQLMQSVLKRAFGEYK